MQRPSEYFPRPCTYYFITIKTFIMQKIVVLFNAPGFTAKHFDQVWDDLRAAGQGSPKGLISHVGFENPEGGWSVVDVWESQDAFNEFGKTLMPIMQKSEVMVPPPKVLPAHFVLVPHHETMSA